ncbi:MAG TPA: YceI family protein [Thermoanaerobaculia bacterium]|jgi:polyisoprenoid-binding protein YceI
MKRILSILSFALAASLLLAPLAWAEPTTWEVDPAHSSVGFSVRHFLTPVPGTFNEFSGTAVYDPDNVAASSVELTVQAASIDTKNDDRDKHLRSADFFNVAEHPTLSFKSDSVKAAGEGELHVTGKFSLHGVTKEITVPVEVLGVMDTPMGRRAGFLVEFTIDRKDYGITWNRALDQGGAVLGDEVKITISVEAKPKAASEG